MPGLFLDFLFAVLVSPKMKIVGNPRNTNKCFLADRSRFGSLHFYPEIFYMISSFSTLASKVSRSGITYLYIYIVIEPNEPITRLISRCKEWSRYVEG